MAAVAFAYRVRHDATNDSILYAEADVSHVSTDTQAAVEAAALAYVRKFADARGKTITHTGTTYGTVGTTRTSTVRYTYT